MVEFEEATLIEKPYIIIDGEKHYVEPATFSGGTPVTPEKLNKMQTDILEMLYPINSLYTTTTNTNPSTKLGGTWELVDKEFAPKYGNTSSDTSLFVPNELESYTFYYSISGHSVWFMLTFTPNSNITDTTKKIGTIHYDKVGLARLPHSIRSVGFSDGANAVNCCSLGYDSGQIDSLDVIPDHSNPAGDRADVVFSVNVPHAMMLDEFCNKFYWKRTA